MVWGPTLNWDDLYTFAIGIEYKIRERTSLRAGYHYDSETAQTSALLPIIPGVEDTHMVTLGIGHRWDLLEVETRQVLVSMSVFDLANGSTEQALRQVSQVEPNVVQPALDQLILLSLVDVLGDLGERRYTLHPLTHYFILSDIVKKWS